MEKHDVPMKVKIKERGEFKFTQCWRRRWTHCRVPT
jgi:hypothetical protein